MTLSVTSNREGGEVSSDGPAIGRGKIWLGESLSGLSDCTWQWQCVDLSSVTRLFPFQTAVFQQETQRGRQLLPPINCYPGPGFAGVREALRWERQEAWDGLTVQ